MKKTVQCLLACSIAGFCLPAAGASQKALFVEIHAAPAAMPQKSETAAGPYVRMEKTAVIPDDEPVQPYEQPVEQQKLPEDAIMLEGVYEQYGTVLIDESVWESEPVQNDAEQTVQKEHQCPQIQMSDDENSALLESLNAREQQLTEQGAQIEVLLQQSADPADLEEQKNANLQQIEALQIRIDALEAEKNSQALPEEPAASEIPVQETVISQSTAVETAVLEEEPSQQVLQENELPAVNPDAADTEDGPALQPDADPVSDAGSEPAAQPVMQPAEDTASQPEPVPADEPEQPEEVLPLQPDVSALDEQIASLRMSRDALLMENEQLDARIEALQTESAPASDFVPADNLHELNIQFDEISRLYDQLASGQISGDKAQALYAQTKDQFEKVCARKREFERITVYRLYNPNSGEHLYTLDANERDYLSRIGWKDEGIGWKAPKYQDQSPVYRVYNPNSGDHHYTMELNERDFLVKEGWRDEKVSWFSDQALQGMAIYRLYNPNADLGSHHYTDSKRENDALVRAGWREEGISWYGINPYSILEQTTDHGSETVGYDEDDRLMSGRHWIAGECYFFSPQTGFRFHGLGTVSDPEQNGKTVTLYALDDGRMQFGWQQFNEGKRYFMPDSGVMAVNFVRTDRGISHFNENGILTTGSFSIGNARLTTDSEGTLISSDLSVQYLSQRDPQWKDLYVGRWKMGGTACVPTVITMILNTLLSLNISPVITAQTLNRNGYYNAQVLGTLAAANPFMAAQNNLVSTSIRNWNDAELVLLAGGMISAAMNPGYFCEPGMTHEIVVWGYHDGKVNVFDPFYTEHNGTYSLSDILAQKSTDGYDCASGGPLFGWNLIL